MDFYSCGIFSFIILLSLQLNSKVNAQAIPLGTDPPSGSLTVTQIPYTATLPAIPRTSFNLFTSPTLITTPTATTTTTTTTSTTTTTTSTTTTTTSPTAISSKLTVTPILPSSSTTTTTTTTTPTITYSGFILLTNVTSTTITKETVETWLNSTTKQTNKVTIVDQKIKTTVTKSNRRRRRRRQANNTTATTATHNQTVLYYITSSTSNNLTTYFNNNFNNNDNSVNQLPPGSQIQTALLWISAEGNQCNDTTCTSTEKCMIKDDSFLTCTSCSTLQNTNTSNNISDLFYKCSATSTGPIIGTNNNNLLGLIAIPCIVVLIILIVVAVCCVKKKKDDSRKRIELGKIHPAVYEATSAGVLSPVRYDDEGGGGTVRSNFSTPRSGFDSVRSGRSTVKHEYVNSDGDGQGLY